MSAGAPFPQVNAKPLLEAELADAVRRGAHPILFSALAAMGIREDRPWGFDHVAFGSQRYWPDPRGAAAFIIACEYGPRLVDLVACRISDRRTATRTGDGQVLGHVWIDRARARGERLIVHSDPLKWLHRGAIGVVILDASQGLQLLKGVREITCEDEALAVRLQGGLGVLGIFPSIDFVSLSSG
jgi:hypothetical protein